MMRAQCWQKLSWQLTLMIRVIRLPEAEMLKVLHWLQGKQENMFHQTFLYLLLMSIRSNCRQILNMVMTARFNDAFEANSEVEVNDKSSHSTEAEVDINNESGSTSRSSNAENAYLVDQCSQLVEAKPEVDVASHRPAGEQLKQLRTSSELSGTLGYMWKSPTIRSSHAYYDGNWSRQYKYSCIPFSGEVTNNRQCIDSSCLHCYLQTVNSPCSCLHLSILIAEDFARSTLVTVVIDLTSLVPRVQSGLQTEFPIFYQETKSDYHGVKRVSCKKTCEGANSLGYATSTTHSWWCTFHNLLSLLETAAATCRFSPL